MIHPYLDHVYFQPSKITRLTNLIFLAICMNKTLLVHCCLSHWVDCNAVLRSTPVKAYLHFLEHSRYGRSIWCTYSVILEIMPKKFSLTNVILERYEFRHPSTDRFLNSYEAEAARLAITAGKIEKEEWSHEKSKRASRILTKARLSKQGCVFPMVIWPAFRMEKYRVNDHPYHAPQFIGLKFLFDS